MSQVSADSLASAGDVPPTATAEKGGGSGAAPEAPPQLMPEQPAAEAMLSPGMKALGHGFLGADFGDYPRYQW